jgi:hypothetical protein
MTFHRLDDCECNRESEMLKAKVRSEENEMPEIPSTIPFMPHTVNKQTSINL